MPNIREQRIDANGIYIVASDGADVFAYPCGGDSALQERDGNAREETRGHDSMGKAVTLGAEQVPMLIRRVPQKANPLWGQPDEPEMVGDYENAYDEEAIKLDFGDLNGFKGLEMRS